MAAFKSGFLYGVVGASRSGKTQFVLSQLKKFRFAMVWDVEEQYTAEILGKTVIRVRSLQELLRTVKKYRAFPKRSAVIAYTGALSDFGGFCQLTFWWVRQMAEHGIETAAVFEETADVTSPAKAPENYGILLRRGLKYGVTLFAISQRPAESDKTAFGNASRLHICRLQLPRDRKSVADMAGVSMEKIEALRADQDAGRFDFITVDCGAGAGRAGVLTFPKGKPKFDLVGDVFTI
jgi:hypothetical protein